MLVTVTQYYIVGYIVSYIYTIKSGCLAHAIIKLWRYAFTSNY